MTIEELVRIFMEVGNQARLYHWQTESFAEHEALGSFYDQWTELTDKFVETYAGLYGRPKGGAEMRVAQYVAGSVQQYIIQVAALMASQNVRSVAPDSALQNIFDEIGGLSQRTAYLLTMKK
jgi:hypothetical protein